MSDSALIHVIAGPTASGKSALALYRAGSCNGVIINADSLQVYDALPILTAQPSAEDKALVPHKLYGALHPNESCSAGRWRAMAMRAIEDTLAQGRMPIITGGSGLYIKALIEGFSPIPDVPDEVRARVVALHDDIGTPAFYERLKQRDPVMAARFHPNHSARLIRAYEVLEATGQSLAHFQALPKETPPAHWRFDLTLVLPEKSLLDSRIERRLVWMLNHGVRDEIAAFYERRDITDNALIHHALGLRPFSAWLEGRLSREEALSRAAADTRQYAKRQMTWFRHQMPDQPAKILTDMK